jgi:hypothetical protein
VVTVAYNNVAGTPGYVVVLTQGSNVRFLRIDTPTGKPIDISDASVPSWMLNWQKQRRAAVVQAAKVSLADAIRTAEASQRGAPAVVAGIARSAAHADTDVHACMVGILQNGHLHRVAVDSLTGLVIEASSAMSL